MSRRRSRLGLALVVILIALIGGGTVTVEGVGALVLGWIGFLKRVGPKVTFSRDGLVSALLCLVPLGIGLHAFLRWLYGNLGMPDGSPRPGRRWRARWTASLLAVVLLMFVAGIAAAGIAHQSGWLIREKGGWTELRAYPGRSVNNLKEIGMGMLNFQSAQYDPPDRLPPGASYDPDGRPLHGWQTLILLYTDIRTDHIDLKVPWDDPRNAAHFNAFIPFYLNPVVPVVRDRDGFGLSHYAGNARVLRRRPTPVASLPNGAANTLLAGEVATRFRPWGEPLTDRDPTAGLNATPDGFANPSGGAVNFIFADGSVRAVRDDVDPKVLRAMSGRLDRE